MDDLTGALAVVGAVAAVCCLAKVWLVTREWHALAGHPRRGRSELDAVRAARRGDA